MRGNIWFTSRSVLYIRYRRQLARATQPAIRVILYRSICGSVNHPEKNQ